MKRGFTLIEVLVVVAIIALLISILVPSLTAARDQARSAKCLANMRDMAMGVQTFAQTHKNRFQLVTGAGANLNPYAANGPKADLTRSLYAYESGGLPMAAQGPALLAWPVVLLREAGMRQLKKNDDWGVRAASRSAALNSSERLRQFELLECPSDKLRMATPVYPWPHGVSDGSGDKWYGTLSYAINEDIVGDDRVFPDSEGACFKDGVVNGGQRLQGMLDKIVRPSEVLMFVDGGTDTLESDAGVEDNQPWNLVLSKDAQGPLLEYMTQTFPNRLPDQRHRGGSLNVTYADGHGGFVNREDKPNSAQGLPKLVYSPKVRISPYNSGGFPEVN